MVIQPLLLAVPTRLSVASAQKPSPAAQPTAAQKVPGASETAADTLELSPEAEKYLGELSDEAAQQVEQLQARDREVRTHEQAHVAAAGPYLRGGPTYSYQKGPDGRRYAVGGEVQIDASPVEGDPEATLRKAQTVRAAALAPAEPSSADRSVAAAATQMEQQARAQLQQEQSETRKPVESESEPHRTFSATTAAKAYASTIDQTTFSALV